MRMECLFCDSEKHDSIKCKKIKSEGARKKITETKKFCRFCFTHSDPPHLPEQKCEISDNCIGWFSTEHHTIFCPERIEAFEEFFLPKIDPQLLSRFFQMIEIDEKYSMILSSPNNLKIASLDRITIADSFCEGNDLNHTGLLVNNLIKWEWEYANLQKVNTLLDSIAAKTIVCIPQKIYIYRSKVSAPMILQLLSSYTKEFIMQDSNCTPNITFTEIIRNAPNLKVFNVYEDGNTDYTNIITDKKWLQDLLKYKIGTNFETLSIKIDYALELDVETLVEFITTKCSKTAKINIKFNINLDYEGEEYGDICIKTEEYFESWGDIEDSWLQLGIDCCDGYEYYSLKELKKALPSKRAIDGYEQVSWRYLILVPFILVPLILVLTYFSSTLPKSYF